jgi:acyl carrier protein
MSADDADAAAVLRALAAQTGLQPEQIALSDLLWAIPGMESVKVLRAIAEIEADRGVTVPDDFLFETATVADLVELISSLTRTGS